MDAPEVFYNRGDLWQFPRALGDIDGSDAQTGFVLMLPMEPSRRENMIAWLAVR
nr:UPF0182 family protein [Burkholderia catarinensis]